MKLSKTQIIGENFLNASYSVDLQQHVILCLTIDDRGKILRIILTRHPFNIKTCFVTP